MSQSFYNSISQVELREVLDFMTHNQSDLIVKLQNRYVRTKVTGKKSDTLFNIGRVGFSPLENEDVTCSFQVREDRYFFKSILNSGNTGWNITIPQEIYQLQRRNDFRVSVPIGIAYECKITSVNGAFTATKAEIRDMSLGGCQLSVAGKTEIKQNDEVDISLKLDRFEFTKLALTARHIKEVDNQGQITSLIGASVHEPSRELVSELQALIMHLDRIHRGRNRE